MSISIATEPAVEPISLNEAKLHLRLEVSNTSPPATHPDDALITALIKASRRWCEKYQNRAYVTQTWDLYLDEFPEDDYIEIPMSPLQSLVSLSYKDGSGVLQVVSFLDPSGTPLFSTTEYIVDTARSRLYLKNSGAWPTSLEEAQAVQIRFICGYGLAADVPEEVKSAILLKLSDLYENRGDVAAPERFEAAAKSLLLMDKIIPI